MKTPKKIIPNYQELIGSLYNPFTVPTARYLSKYEWVSPNFISILVLLVGILAAWLIIQTSFIIAAVLMMVMHFLDAIDGKITRFRGTSSDFGAWMDKITGHTAYILIFIAFIFAFSDFWAQLSGAVILGFYTLITIIGNAFYSIVNKSDKKVKIVKKKKWYMKLFGVTLLPPFLIITTLIGYPVITWYFFAIGFVGFFLVMALFHFLHFMKNKS
jgi:phosphatidylglycerophosphate synthase